MNAIQNFDTLVVEGLGNSVPREIAGLRVAAWASGHALDRTEELETFIRDLASGDIEDPKQAANELMERMKWA